MNNIVIVIIILIININIILSLQTSTSTLSSSLILNNRNNRILYNKNVVLNMASGTHGQNFKFLPMIRG